jgi:hypothetical protein
MVDKTETITLLPHPFNRDDQELVDQDSRTPGTSQGQEVWKLVARAPWSDFPVTYLTYPRTDTTKPTIGSYQVELNRGGAKRGKEGSSNDWDYFWNAITWKLLGEQDAPAPSDNGGQPAAPRIVGGSSTAEEKKDRSVALSYAKDAWCAGKIERAELIELAGLFHDAMVNGFEEEE